MKTEKMPNRYWGSQDPPKSKGEFFNAVTMPAAGGDSSVATIRMYGPIDSWGGYWGVSAQDMSEVLDGLDSSVATIILRINSGGGEVFEGVSILNMLRAHSARVIAVVDGLAASAASVIAVGCDEVVMSPGTQMMIHSPSMFVGGNAEWLRKQAEVLDSIEASIVEIYTDKAGEKDWAAMLSEETWMTSAEAVAQGLADRIDVVPDAGATSTAGDGQDIPEDPAADEPLDADHRTLVASSDSRNLPDSTEPGNPNRKENLMAYEDLKAGLVERLGVTDAAVEDGALLTVLDDRLAAPSNTVAVPEGAVVVDRAAFETLQSNAQAGAEARAELDSQRRDRIVDNAMREGRIAAAARDTWRTKLDENEKVTAELLAVMPANTVPVVEIGNAGENATAADSLYDIVDAALGNGKDA